MKDEAVRLARKVDPILESAMRATRMLRAVTPVNAASERARLVASIERGEDPRPKWEYAPPSDDAARDLDGLARALEMDASPIATMYAARAREIAGEMAIARLAGSAKLGGAARARFASDAADDAEADACADAWLRVTPDADEARAMSSDDESAGSLLVRMREEVGRRHLPFAVVVDPSLSALAATGERTIFVAKGRMVTAADVARTVLHEIEGHAEPRARAARASIGLFAIGTARGADDQEGFALLLEDRAAHFTSARRRELAARHAAARAMDKGATFVDVCRSLTRDIALAPRAAVAIAERVFRGSHGEHPGLGRERVYLAAFARVRRRLAQRKDDEAILRAGQIAIGCIEGLRAYVD